MDKKAKLVTLVLSLALSSCGDSEVKDIDKSNENEGSVATQFVELAESKDACDDFKKAKDLADVVEQVYRHIDKQCFYQQSGDELSKKLGVAVINHTDFVQEGKFQLDKYQIEENRLQNRECNRPFDGVMIMLNPSRGYDSGNPYDRSTIFLTDCYLKKYGGFDEDTAWMSKLPSMEVLKSQAHAPAEGDSVLIDEDDPSKPFLTFHYYVWYSNSNKGNSVFYIDTWASIQVRELKSYRNIDRSKKLFY